MNMYRVTIFPVGTWNRWCITETENNVFGLMCLVILTVESMLA